LGFQLNEKGELKRNTSDNDVNAVTWGVFPGREIIQPTIVEGDSFTAWKVNSEKLINRTKHSTYGISGRTYSPLPVMLEKF
jgi:methylenetetrahydrofolate reductase (NADPH)